VITEHKVFWYLITEHKVFWYVITELLAEHAASVFRINKEAECAFEKFVNIALPALSHLRRPQVMY
jgi:hypothetical protein